MRRTLRVMGLGLGPHSADNTAAGSTCHASKSTDRFSPIYTRLNGQNGTQRSHGGHGSVPSRALLVSGFIIVWLRMNYSLRVANDSLRSRRRTQQSLLPRRLGPGRPESHPCCDTVCQRISADHRSAWEGQRELVDNSAEPGMDP
ncbi:hypothetical protein OH77DRAFT_116303 [Trametes cingulata]|nr:hypothetical protein OH77DRAFT_116303 [Trametes cingulata]